MGTAQKSVSRLAALKAGKPFKDPNTGKVTVTPDKKKGLKLPSEKKALDDDFLDEAEGGSSRRKKGR